MSTKKPKSPSPANPTPIGSKFWYDSRTDGPVSVWIGPKGGPLKRVGGPAKKDRKP